MDECLSMKGKALVTGNGRQITFSVLLLYLCSDEPDMLI